METIDRLCAAARHHGASDLFLHAGKVPQIRLHGQLTEFGEPPLPDGEIESFWTACGTGLDEADRDGGYVSSEGVRYRVNFFRALGLRGAVLRPIRTEVPPLDSLGVPVDLLLSWSVRPAGLVLVAGPTGSGKSTTIASCLDWLNRNHPRHVVTIEDPIEYLFEPRLSLLTQREVGPDTPTFAEGLRRALRQSPDVIWLGEIRDAESAVTALQAAETGHLVLSTLHSSTVLDSLERLVRLFDAGEREGVLQVLSQQLVGVLCQKLVPAQPEGRVLAFEHFENQASTRKWILERKFGDLADFIARGDNPANVTFLHSLAALVRSGRVAEEDALAAAAHPHELQRLLKGVGISRGSRA